MSAEETLKLIAKQWCTLEDIMKLGHLGRNSALKAKKKIKDKLEKQGYHIPKSVVPTKEVVAFFVSFTGELWRIIGVFNKTRLKIIRDEPYSTGMAWDTDDVNDWTTASLQEELNTTYLNSIQSPYKEMISNAKWNLGGTANYTSSSNGLTSHFYGYERGTTVYTGRPTEWTGSIGLMYPADYGYATSGGRTTNRASCLAKELYNWDSVSDCYNNDCLYSGISQWTLTPYSGYSTYVFYVGSNGYVSRSIVNVTVNAVSPALYLSSNVKIDGGDGSESNPFTLSL